MNIWSNHITCYQILKIHFSFLDVGHIYRAIKQMWKIRGPFLFTQLYYYICVHKSESRMTLECYIFYTKLPKHIGWLKWHWWLIFSLDNLIKNNQFNYCSCMIQPQTFWLIGALQIPLLQNLLILWHQLLQ